MPISDKSLRGRLLLHSKNAIIKKKYALRYLAGQERVCRVSGRAQQITPQLLNLRSKDQDTHRILEVALQPWPTLAGTEALVGEQAGVVVDVTTGAIDYKGRMLQLGEDASTLSAQVVKKMPNVLEVWKSMRRGQLKMEQFKTKKWDGVGEEALLLGQDSRSLIRFPWLAPVLEALQQEQQKQLEMTLMQLNVISRDNLARPVGSGQMASRAT